MKDLLRAFEIFFKYIPHEKYPTRCGHDIMYVGCDPSLVSEEDISELEELGFWVDNIEEVFYSHKFGS